ncbi:Hypothetical protein KVN_LOCUS450 [uncultured virus]|nr:Hypothetical protein KVN_LOCUS450 [uncultured virus]
MQNQPLPELTVSPTGYITSRPDLTVAPTGYISTRPVVVPKDAFYANIHWGYIIVGLILICCLCCCSSSSLALFRNELYKLLGINSEEGFKSINKKKKTKFLNH